MKKRKLILSLRRAALLLCVVLIALSLALHFVPGMIQSGATTRSAVIGDVLEPDATVTEKLESYGIMPDIPGVEPGQIVEFTAPETMHLLGYGVGSGDADYYMGEPMVICFDSLPTDGQIDMPYGKRLVSVDDTRRMRLLMLDEDQLVSSYIAWLEQSGQTGVFEQETGMELTRKNARAVLTAADKQLFEKGIMYPSTYPNYMRTARTLRNTSLALMGVSMAFLCTMLVVCHFVDTTDWTENNMKRWEETAEQRGTLRMTSISKSSERAPVEDKNKNKTRQELFKDLI